MIREFWNLTRDRDGLMAILNNWDALLMGASRLVRYVLGRAVPLVYLAGMVRIRLFGERGC